MEIQFSRSEEDYLMALARIGNPAKTSELARALNIADPSVTSMTGKLAGKGLVVQELRRPVKLTTIGEKIANKLLSRHRLIELFLTKIMDYGWDEVHEEAHRLEHAVSDRFVRELNRIMGDPERDPHGQLIKQSTTSEQVSLSSLEPGQRATVVEVDDSDPEFLRYLAKNNLFPDTELKIVSVQPFGGLLELQVGGKEFSLGNEAAERILVKINT